jgi:hypothetical protein
MRYQYGLTFDGKDYDHERDNVRLTGRMNRIFELMKDGKWRTLREVSDVSGTPEASASSALRDFRKAKFGGYTVEKRYVSNGLYEYKLIIDDTQDVDL